MLVLDGWLVCSNLPGDSTYLQPRGEAQQNITWIFDHNSMNFYWIRIKSVPFGPCKCAVLA